MHLAPYCKCLCAPLGISDGGFCDREMAVPGGLPPSVSLRGRWECTEGTESMRSVACHLGQKSFQEEISTDSVSLLHSQIRDCHPELIR